MIWTQPTQESEHNRQVSAGKRTLAEENISYKAAIGEMMLMDQYSSQYKNLKHTSLCLYGGYLDAIKYIIEQRDEDSMDAADTVFDDTLERVSALDYNTDDHEYQLLLDPIIVRYTNFLLQDGRLFDAVSAFYYKRASSPSTYHAIIFYVAIRTSERTIETQQEFGGKHADTLEKLITLNKDLGPLALLLNGIKHHTQSYLPINERNQEAVETARRYYKRCMAESSTDKESWFLVSAYAAQRLAKLYDENDLNIRDDYYEIILTLGIFLTLVKCRHLKLTLYRNIVPEDFEINEPLFDVDTYFQALRYYTEFDPVSSQWWRLRVDEMQILLAMTTVSSLDKLNLLDQVVIFMRLAEQEEKAVLLQGEADELRSEDSYYYYSSDEEDE